MANVLTTKEEVKLSLEDIAGTNTFDALLDALILGVSQRFELGANRKLFSATKTELHDGGSSRIYVKAPPITSITSITYAPSYDFANGTVLGASEYILDPSDKKNCVYSTYVVFPGGADSLKVIYVGGYLPADDANSNVPEAAKFAATQQVVYLFKNRKTLGLDNVNIGDGILQKVSNKWFLPEVADVIRQLRIKNIY